MYQVSTYFVNIATMIDQCYIPRNVLDSLLNVVSQELLFGVMIFSSIKLVAYTTKEAITITDNIYWLSSYAS